MLGVHTADATQDALGIERETVVQGANSVARRGGVAAVVVVVAVASQLRPMAAALLLAVSVPITFYATSGLFLYPSSCNEQAESSQELEAELMSARANLKSAEARRRASVEGSAVDRGVLYRLRGDLAALSCSEERAQFLLDAAGVSDVGALGAERTRFRSESLSACRVCEEERLLTEAVAEDVDGLKARVRALESEIESTLQRGEAEEASRHTLGEETTRLRAQVSRLHAKITAHDARLLHARQELKALGGGRTAEQRRLEAEVASNLQEKRREVRSEEEQLKRTQGEKRFAESVGDKLRSTLRERVEQVEASQEQLRRGAQEQESLQQAIACAQAEIGRLETEATTGCTLVAGDAADEGVEPLGSVDARTPKAKSKAGKSSKAKRRKDLEGPTNPQLEDLELELAAVVAGREKAEQLSVAAAARGEARLGSARVYVSQREADCQGIGAKLEALAREREDIAKERQKMDAMLADHVKQVEDLQKRSKDMEREKIRLRLDIKLRQDALREAAATSTASPAVKAKQEVAEAEVVRAPQKSTQIVKESTDSSSLGAKPEQDQEELRKAFRRAGQDSSCPACDGTGLLVGDTCPLCADLEGEEGAEEVSAEGRTLKDSGKQSCEGNSSTEAP